VGWKSERIHGVKEIEAVYQLISILPSSRRLEREEGRGLEQEWQVPCYRGC
jgi:hypothetical protein